MSDMIDRDAAMKLRDTLADIIGAAPMSSIHSALSEYRKAIHALPAVEVGVKPLEWVATRALRKYLVEGEEIIEFTTRGPFLYTLTKNYRIGRSWSAYRGRNSPIAEGTCVTLEAAKAAAQADCAARIRSALTVTPAPDAGKVASLYDPESHWGDFLKSAVAEAEKAMRKYPQPNYVISKVAEEAGEVVKAAIHCAEGRDTAENVRGEMRQLIAMLYRIWVEGDQVHGLPPVSAALAAMKEG